MRNRFGASTNSNLRTTGASLLMIACQVLYGAACSKGAARERTELPPRAESAAYTERPADPPLERSEAKVSATQGARRPELEPARELSAKAPVPDDMLEVPGGEFRMGADDEGELDERPAHSVKLESFLLDKTEVTNAAYLECVKAKVCRAADSLEGSPLVNGKAREFRLPDHPVAGVSWDDAKAYCAFRHKRLPREAEWERAARGGDGRRYVWGNDDPDPKRHGVFGGQPTTRPVGLSPEGHGPYGHLDLAGNVWEWMEDAYDPLAYQRPTADQGTPGSCEEILAAQDQLRREGKQGFTGTNPIPTVCERVLRGGAYNYRLNGLRASNRVHHPANFRIAVAGFRCAKDR